MPAVAAALSSLSGASIGHVATIVAGMFVLASQRLHLPLVPASVAAAVGLLVGLAPGALEALIGSSVGQFLTPEEDFLSLLLLVVVMIGIGRLLLDMRNQARLQRALLPACPMATAYAGQARRRVRVAYSDLTGVLRRVSTVNGLQGVIERVRRSRDRRLVLAFIDVRPNGHGKVPGRLPAADTIAHGLAVSLRKQDTVFRYGGDELLCVMPHIDSAQAERLLTEMRARMRQGGLDFGVTLAPWQEGEDAEALLLRAERAANPLPPEGDGEVGEPAAEPVPAP